MLKKNSKHQTLRTFHWQIHSIHSISLPTCNAELVVDGAIDTGDKKINFIGMFSQMFETSVNAGVKKGRWSCAMRNGGSKESHDTVALIIYGKISLLLFIDVSNLTQLFRILVYKGLKCRQNHGFLPWTKEL
jgi:hypothetical protein